MISEKTRGLLAVTGGCCIHLMLGSFYLWGVISTYVTSYFISKGNPDLTISDVNIIFPTSSVMSCLFLHIGLSITQKWGSRRSTFCLGLLNTLAVFLSSYATSFWEFYFLYGVCQGALNGTLYMSPLKIGVKYFPQNKGVVSGFIIGSYGCATLIISFLVVFIINPNNLQPEYSMGQYRYPESINQNVPIALRYVSLYFLFLTIFGSLFLKNKKAASIILSNKGSRRYLDSLAIDNDDSENDCSPMLKKRLKTSTVTKKIDKINQLKSSDQLYDLDSQWDCFRTKEFYALFFMIYFSVIFGYYMASSYKDYGFTKIDDDQYLSLIVGNCASISNGFSRFLFGCLLDFFGFRQIYFILLLTQMTIIVSMEYVASNKTMYCIWVIITMACEGAHFVLFPSKTIEIYGLKYGTNIYSYVYYAFCCANLTQTFLIGYLKTSFNNDYVKIFYIFLALTSISLLLNIFFSFKFTLSPSHLQHENEMNINIKPSKQLDTIQQNDQDQKLN